MRFDTSLERGIVDWLNTVSSITWMWDKQKYSRVDLPYGTINILNVEIDDNPSTTKKDDNTLTYHYKGQMTISLNIYGDSSCFYYMNEIERSLKQELIREDLVADGLYYRTKGVSRDLSRLLDTEYEFRCQNDFVFGFALDEDETTLFIERISGTINDIPFDETI